VDRLPTLNSFAPALSSGRAEAGELEVKTDKIDRQDENRVILEGNVLLRNLTQALQADRIEYLRDSEQISAQGQITLTSSEMQLKAESAEMDLISETSNLNQVSYLLNSGGRGLANTATTGNQGVAQLQDVTYTYCPTGNSDWQLKAREMILDQNTGRGYAKGVGLRFKGVPFFYLPRASFPLDDRRQSGFLYPSIGSSNDDGFDVQIPYYWNIAPNQDATITPRLISDRGLLLGVEYRYLNKNSLTQIQTEYLPDDDIADTDRGLSSVRHRGTYANRWRLNLDLNHVSDDAFFEDFSDSLSSVSRSFLRSRAELSTAGESWEAGIALDAFETVDRDIAPQNEPYERLPRLFFSSASQIANSAWFLEADAEAVAFDRDEGITGNRLDLFPRVSRPIYEAAYYLNPTLGLRHTQYDLDRVLNDSPSRTQGIASLEGGLFFERSLNDGRRQTLEPRFYYLYVPFDDQTDIPQFDTREITFGFGQLFRTNRFTGADRQADANQISLALTTRLYSADGGRQELEASLGTIYYFDDQRVQLSGQNERDDSTSPLVAELNYRPSDFWRVSLGFQWDPEDREFDQAQVNLQRRFENGKLLNFAYRKRIDRVEQLDASFYWPLNERWDLVGRWNYSLLDDANLEALLGFEYESCCWAFRMFGRRFVRNQLGDERNSIYFELELKGLGSFGRRTERLLQRSIYGYRSGSDRVRT